MYSNNIERGFCNNTKKFQNLGQGLDTFSKAFFERLKGITSLQLGVRRPEPWDTTKKYQKLKQLLNKMWVCQVLVFSLPYGPA